MADEIDIEQMARELSRENLEANYCAMIRKVTELTAAIAEYYPLIMGKGDGAIDTAIKLVDRCHQLENSPMGERVEPPAHPTSLGEVWAGEVQPSFAAETMRHNDARERREAQRPMPKIASELEAIVAGELTKILGSNIHAEVWDRRQPNQLSRELLPPWYELTFPELEANAHLYERLGIANAALGALKGYTDQPRGFVLDRSQPDLAKKTGWIQGEDLAQMIAADSVKVGVDQKSWDRKQGAPLRGIVFAEPVEATDRNDGKPTYLVTLICGHKVYTDKKLTEYPCLECAPWTSPPATPARLEEMVEKGIVTEAPIPDEVVQAQAQQIADDVDKGFERQILGRPVPVPCRGVDVDCESCGQRKGSTLDNGWWRCNGCGYPGQ